MGSEGGSQGGTRGGRGRSGEIWEAPSHSTASSQRTPPRECEQDAAPAAGALLRALRAVGLGGKSGGGLARASAPTAAAAAEEGEGEEGEEEEEEEEEEDYAAELRRALDDAAARDEEARSRAISGDLG